MANEKSFKEAWKCDQERFTCDIVVGFAFVRLMLNNFFTYERSCAVRVREREREREILSRLRESSVVSISAIMGEQILGDQRAISIECNEISQIDDIERRKIDRKRSRIFFAPENARFVSKYIFADVLRCRIFKIISTG